MERKDRRQHPRAELPVPMEYRFREDPMGRWYQGLIMNMSAGGLRCTCERLVEEGTTLEFRLRLPGRQEPYQFSGTVIWTKPVAATIECGIAFQAMPPEQQFDIDEVVQFLMAKRIKDP